MRNEKNSLATLSPQQSNPYAATPEDFTVTPADEFATRYTPDHGQCGKSKSEYKQLIAQGNAKRNIGTPERATETSDAAKPGDGLGRKSKR